MAEAEYQLEIFNQTVREEMNSLSKELSLDYFQDAVDMIMGAEKNGGRIHISGIGKPHHIACYMASLFSSTGTPCYVLDGTEWIDIQYIRKGRERIDVKVTGAGLQVEERKVEKDVIFYRDDGSDRFHSLYLEDGMLAVFYPEDIHRPCICIGEPQAVEKVVFKIRIAE